MFEDDEELPSIEIDYFSQTDNDDIFETNKATNLSPKQFYCSGEVMLNDKSLNENSFLRTNELEYLNTMLTFNPVLNLFNESMDCTLFNRTYNCGTLILNDLERLFNISSQTLKFIFAASIAQSNKIGPSVENYNYYLKRKQITEFIYFLRHFLCRSWQLDCNYIILKRTVITGMKKLLFHNITSLPEYIINHAGSKLGNESKNPAYHLFHLYLELKWLFLTIKYDLHIFSETRQENIIFTNNSDNVTNLTFNINDKTDFERELKILMSDLIQIAVNIFNKTDPSYLVSVQPFNCVCVKELWIMIQVFIEQTNAVGKCRMFWEIFNEILEQISSSVNITHANCSEIQLPFLFNCNNPSIFSIWITCHVALLQGYTKKGIFVGKDNNLRIVSNYGSIITNLSAWLNSEEISSTEPKQTEIYLRSLMPLLSQIIITWWDPKSEPIATLWEYFHRRLNSLFYLPTDPPQSMATICNTSSALLTQIKLRLQQDKMKPVSEYETSYQHFLRLIGLFLKYCFENNQQNQYQKLKGRIFPKFSLNKLVALNQTGLYNFVSLFLTMAVSADLQEAGLKLQSLLSLLPTLESSSNKMPILLSANLAIIQLFVENKLNIKEISNPLLILLSQIDNETNSCNANLRQIIIDGLQQIFEASEEFNSGEYILIDSWISRWLSISNTSSSFSPIYDILITITTKLHILCMNTNTLYDSDKEFLKMSQNIFQHVLPALKQNAKSININLQLADLISSVMLLSLDDQPLANKNSANFFTLFVYFVTSQDISLRLIEKILSKLLKAPNVLIELDKSFTNYQFTIIQLWLQCNLTCIENNCENLTDILRIIIDLPDIRTNYSEFSTLLESSDHISTFFQIISQKYDLLENIDDRNKIRNFLTEILNGIDNRITFILKSQSPDEKIIIHGYTIVAKLFFHCSHLIYIKNTPLCFFHILVTLMLLPPALFTGRKLHPFCVGAIRQNWVLFLQGVARNDYMKDPYIQKTLKDLTVQYVPYFSNKPGELSRRQPFLKIFDNDFKHELTSFVLTNIVSNYLHISGGKTPKPNALHALFILKEILNQIRFDNSNVILFTNCCFDGILEQIMFLESTELSKKVAVELFNIIIRTLSPYFDTPDVRESILKCIRTLTKKHLGFHSMQVMRLLTYLAQECWIIIDTYLPELLEEVNNVESIRCVRYDTGLRNMVAKVANTVESSRNK